MKEHFPAFTHRIGRGGQIVWRGELRPTDESVNYPVRIVHRVGRTPKVFVDSLRGEPAKHQYPDRSLCLFDPKAWQWTNNTLMAETLLPWTALWLYYHEIWRFSGEWCGPEAPHAIPKKRSRRRKRFAKVGTRSTGGDPTQKPIRSDNAGSSDR